MKTRYRNRCTSRLYNIRTALRLLRSHAGSVPVSQFGPLALHSIRRALIEQGLVRTTINDRIAIIQAAFKWGVGRELVPPGVPPPRRVLPPAPRPSDSTESEILDQPMQKQA